MLVTVLARRWKASLPKRVVRCQHLSVSSYAASGDHQLVREGGTAPPSYDWYRKSYPKLLKMAQTLAHVDQIDDGRVFNVDDNSTVTDDRVVGQLLAFKSIARAFVGSPAMQQALLISSGTQSRADGDRVPVFGREEERATMTLDSLTKVCNFLQVSAQRRKAIRLTLCRQIAQQRIWRGALLDLLQNLGSEMTTLPRLYFSSSSSLHMCEQIVSTCAKLLAGTSDKDTTPLWMHLSSPTSRSRSRRIDATMDEPPNHLSRWGEVLEIFGDLTEWMEKEQEVRRLLGGSHLPKIEAMKEGLYQIKDMAMEQDIGYNEARRQDCLVQRKLSHSLGHSSKCLFTLLLYYLYGTTRDVQVDACGLYRDGGGPGARLCVGKVLTSDDQRTVRAGVKQLDRAVGLFKFVWETTSAEAVLRPQGHLWCVGAEERTLTYRGTTYSLHAFRF